MFLYFIVRVCLYNSSLLLADQTHAHEVLLQVFIIGIIYVMQHRIVFIFQVEEPGSRRRCFLLLEGSLASLRVFERASSHFADVSLTEADLVIDDMVR